MKFLNCFILIFIALLSTCSAYRILGVFPFNAKSHNIVFEALMKGLAKHGHQVDVITHFPLKKPLKNYTEIINLDGSMESTINNYTIKFINEKVYGGLTLIAESYGNRICHFMGFEEMQKLIRNPPKDPPYDVVIVEAFGAHCFMGLGYVLNVPVVAVSSASEYPWVSYFTGNDDNPAYVPNGINFGIGEMNIWQRFRNLLDTLLIRNDFQARTECQTELMRKYLSPDIPDIRTVERNVALTLVNSHPILLGVKPITPSLVQIAGIHIEENDETLSPELQKWMDESKDGVIYFSLGSMVLIESLEEKFLLEMYESFKKIAPVRVLMKVVDTSKLPPGLPKNIKVLPWIPQIPVLAHPNTKVFITHGGLGGIEEGLYHGVPMIGIPLFGDQFLNVKALVHKGMMIHINYKDLCGTLLDQAINELLSNPSYKKNAVFYSKLFRDDPLSPVKRAVFWIEYVIRNGPDVLRSPALNFHWWQLQLLDIYCLILLTAIIGLTLIIFILKLVLKQILKVKQVMKKKMQ